MDAPAAVSHPAKGLANTFKNPKALAVVGILAVGFMLYFRSRNKGTTPLQSVDGSGTAVTDPNAAYYPDPTQGAANPTTGQGYYGGSDSPQEPDWMLNPPDWVTGVPSWWNNPPASTGDGSSGGGNEPAATNPNNPITFNGGHDVYDPSTHTVYGPPVPTGGGPPNPTSHATPAKKKTPAGAVTVVRTNQSGNKNDGKTYVVVKNPKEHPKGTYHVYGTGKNAQYVRMG